MSEAKHAGQGVNGASDLLEHQSQDKETRALTLIPLSEETPEQRQTRLAARATLQNALHGIPKAQLFAEVDDFCKRSGLQDHIDIFRKGALLAQRPKDWESIEELSLEERASIEYEHQHR